MAMTAFPSGKVVAACAAAITWCTALLKQAIALKEEARDLIVR